MQSMLSNMVLHKSSGFCTRQGCVFVCHPLKHGIQQSYAQQEPFPSRRVARTRGLLASVSESMSDSLSGSVDEAPGVLREYFSKPFEFLSLGLLAYIGAPLCLPQGSPRLLCVWFS